MSPRRSSRARTTQPLPGAAPQTNSSTSSISSGRADRSVRSHHKRPSPPSPRAPPSRSSPEADDQVKLQIRRTRSSQDDAKDKIELPPEEEDDEEGEEEVTRCVCGHQEYPGMPVPIGDVPKVSSKSGGGPDPSVSSVALPEDAGGLFIQCDICKVWQHGGCVGIMEVALSPDEYFCEQCRKDSHRITTTASGQRYSRYLPLQGSAFAASSVTPSPQDTISTRRKEGKSSRTNAESLAGNRRSTMNSRDAAYDEAEQLQRAIEESKKEGATTNTLDGPRRGKRSRSDSESRREDTKRQRTGSDSSTSLSERKTLSLTGLSEDEADKPSKAAGQSHKKMRGAAAKNRRDKEIREREEKREKERADAAGRRKGRAERRRGDDSEPSEEPPSRNTSSKEGEPSLPPVASQPSPPDSTPIPKPSHHKKTGRPPARRGRVGRNQYTKDRDSRPDTTNSPLRSHSQSGDADKSPRHLVNGNGNTSAGNNYNWGPNTENGKPSKPRYMNPNRTTLNDMKRRVSGILDFLSRTQVEMATSNGRGEETSVTNPSSRSLTRTHSTVTLPITNGGGKTVAQPLDGHENGLSGSVKDPGNATSESISSTGLDVEAFRSLNSVEMMEALTRGLTRWQGDFGKVGEK